ncbi:MAG: OmpH family outer membrane protein [Chromatiaceae bacterium]|jgi:outer membrane protein
MSIRRIVTILALALPFATLEAASLGYVDIQKVLEQSTLGKKVQEELRKEFEPRAQELGKTEAEIRQLQETLARDSALMSADQVKKKEAEIKQRIEAYQKAGGALQQEVAKVQQQKGREVMAPAQKAVDAVAKQNKLPMVVERSLTGILYLDPGLDITDDVIKHMDASAK